MSERGIELILELISGKWKIRILLELMRDGKPLRFTQLLNILSPVSRRMLTMQLREMESHGLIERRAMRNAPGGVEYSLTPLAWSLHPVLETMNLWTLKHW